MNKPRHLLHTLLWTVIGLCGGFIVLAVLATLVSSGPGYLDAVFHLVAGCWFFVSEKLPTVSSDAGTWGPGLVAWVVALAVGHRFLRNWAAARGRRWRVTTTACLGLVLPVLFVISFIVPGILLQVDGLREERWFNRSSMKLSSLVMLELRNRAQACAILANESSDGKYPDSLAALEARDLVRGRLLDFSNDPNTPPEPPLYLGAGYTRETAGDAPLAISPRFHERGSWQRIVVTVDGSMIVIHDDEVDAWLDRVVPR